MHLWLSPEIARATAVAIHGKLVELMPQSRAKLDANLKDFEAQLASTETQVGNELAPLRERLFRFSRCLRLLRKTVRTDTAWSFYR